MSQWDPLVNREPVQRAGRAFETRRNPVSAAARCLWPRFDLLQLGKYGRYSLIGIEPIPLIVSGDPSV